MKGNLGIGLLLLMGHIMFGVVVIGHRGASGYAPENTLLAFEKAVELGVAMVELDVQLCKSGELVVFHDQKLDDKTDGQGSIAEKTLTQLKQLDAGSGQQIPTLQEVFDTINRRIKINIELKGEGTVEPVVKLIEFYIKYKDWSYDDFLVTSFDHYRVLKVKELSSSIPTGVLISGIPITLGECADAARADVVVVNHETINQLFIDDIHRRDKRIFVFSVNDGEEITAVITLGVDGVISDFPDRVLEMVDSGLISS